MSGTPWKHASLPSVAASGFWLPTSPWPVALPSGGTWEVNTRAHVTSLREFYNEEGKMGSLPMHFLCNGSYRVEHDSHLQGDCGGLGWGCVGMTRRSDKQHGKNSPGVRSCGGKRVPPKSATSFHPSRTRRARRAGDERRLPLRLSTGAQHTFPWA